MHPTISQLAIVKEAGIRSYLGVPILVNEEYMYGTLCVISKDTYQFTAEEVGIIVSLAKLLANSVDLIENIMKRNNELVIAQRLQQCLLSKPIKNETFSIDAIFQPSEHLAGDMYYWTDIHQGLLAVFIMDVSGSGLPSSLINTTILAQLKTLIVSDPDPFIVMNKLSKSFCELTNLAIESYYFTAIYMVVDIEAKKVKYVNAGHPNGVILSRNNRMVTLPPTCSPVGLFEVDIEARNVDMEDCNKILLFTDGLLEQIDPSLHAATTQVAQWTQNHSLKMISDLIKKKPSKREQDDCTLISISID
jgi:phosphoserine phosphatase RsbU/P